MPKGGKRYLDNVDMAVIRHVLDEYKRVQRDGTDSKKNEFYTKMKTLSFRNRENTLVRQTFENRWTVKRLCANFIKMSWPLAVFPKRR